jgi:hypothetical protein
MADLKTDLLQEVGRKKYFSEMELVRLANDGAMNYEEKVSKISSLIGEIALLNAKGDLIGSYFQEPQTEGGGEPDGEPEQPVEEPATNVVEEAPEVVEKPE